MYASIEYQDLKSIYVKEIKLEDFFFSSGKAVVKCFSFHISHFLAHYSNSSTSASAYKCVETF